MHITSMKPASVFAIHIYTRYVRFRIRSWPDTRAIVSTLLSVTVLYCGAGDTASLRLLGYRTGRINSTRTSCSEHLRKTSDYSILLKLPFILYVHDSISWTRCTVASGMPAGNFSKSASPQLRSSMIQLTWVVPHREVQCSVRCGYSGFRGLIFPIFR